MDPRSLILAGLYTSFTSGAGIGMLMLLMSFLGIVFECYFFLVVVVVSDV